jgi:hypothetical protein
VKLALARFCLFSVLLTAEELHCGVTEKPAPLHPRRLGGTYGQTETEQKRKAEASSTDKPGAGLWPVPRKQCSEEVPVQTPPDFKNQKPRLFSCSNAD